MGRPKRPRIQPWSSSADSASLISLEDLIVQEENDLAAEALGVLGSPDELNEPLYVSLSEASELGVLSDALSLLSSSSSESLDLSDILDTQAPGSLPSHVEGLDSPVAAVPGHDGALPNVDLDHLIDQGTAEIPQS